MRAFSFIGGHRDCCRADVAINASAVFVNVNCVHFTFLLSLVFFLDLVCAVCE